MSVQQTSQNGVTDISGTGYKTSLILNSDRFSQSDISRIAEKSRKSNKDSPQKKLSILIVDDDSQLTRFLDALLNESFDDVDILIANDGFDAGIKLREFSPDVILIDLMMPGLGGIEVCENIKSIPDLSHIKVIAMTGYPSSENVEQILAAGAEACLTKPFQSSELFDLLGLISPR